MRIVCVKWGDKYGPEYVHKLKAACERHIPHEAFHCMTEDPVPGVQWIPFPPDPPSTWWSKVCLFKPYWISGDVLYLDLDVVITDSIQPFIDAFESDKSKLWALDDFSYSLQEFCKDGQPDPESEVNRGWLGGPGNSTLNSSVMMWNSTENPAVRGIYLQFNDELMDRFHGDQNWITNLMWPQFRLFPPGIAASYKYGGHQAAPIVIFHGDPKPPDVTDRWVVENW